MCAIVTRPFRPGEHESVKGLDRETRPRARLEAQLKKYAVEVVSSL